MQRAGPARRRRRRPQPQPNEKRADNLFSNPGSGAGRGRVAGLGGWVSSSALPLPPAAPSRPPGSRRAHTHFLTISEHTLAARPPAAPQLLSPARPAARRGRLGAKLPLGRAALECRRPPPSGGAEGGGGPGTPAQGWGAAKERRRERKVRQRWPLFLCYNPECVRARARAGVSVQMCARACVQMRACVRARVCKCVPVCAGRDCLGVAGPPGTRRFCLQGSCIASPVFLALPGTRVRRQVAVPLSPASAGTELGVCCQTRAVQGGAVVPAGPAGLRKVEAPAEGRPRPQGAREGVSGHRARLRGRHTAP